MPYPFGTRCRLATWRVASEVLLFLAGLRFSGGAVGAVGAVGAGGAGGAVGAVGAVGADHEGTPPLVPLVRSSWSSVGRCGTCRGCTGRVCFQGAMAGGLAGSARSGCAAVVSDAVHASGAHNPKDTIRLAVATPARPGVTESRGPVILATMSRKVLVGLAYSLSVARHLVPQPDGLELHVLGRATTSWQEASHRQAVAPPPVRHGGTASAG